MKIAKQQRAEIFFFVVLLFLFFSNIQEIRGTARRIYRFRDLLAENRNNDIMTFDSRFTELRKVLPREGIVGYVSDNYEGWRVILDGTLKRYPYDHPGWLAIRDYYMTQYALAPVIVDRTQEHKLVVGDCRTEAVGEYFPGDTRLLLLRNFGNGLYLFTLNGCE